jgi:hypothetical protein
MEQLCVKSFLANGHYFDLYAYGPLSGIPAGTNVRDASEILPASALDRYQRRNVLALFADWFRWELLAKRGGCYVDMDVICLRPLEFNADVVFGWQSVGVPCNAVMAFPAAHPAAIALADRCRRPNRFRHNDSLPRRIKKGCRFLLGNDPARIGWGEAGGPAGFQEAVQQYDLGRFGLPYIAFYPVYFLNWISLFDETFADIRYPFPGSFTVHLWNENTRNRPRWDKNATFPYNSFVERMKRRYGVG